MGYGKAVSIHAPHEGERPFTGVQKTVDATVSIHAPHEGERLYFPTFFSTASKFQSTLPTRGSDLRGWRYMLLLVRFQSTLPTRGSDHEFLEQSDAEWVSIHAPHEGERRLSSLRVASYLSCFNPRSPRGGATLISGASSSQTMVSIHAPHEGERRLQHRHAILRRTVSIHAPHEGERRRKSAFVCSISANLLNIIHCGTVTRAVSRRRIALFRLFSVRRSGVFMYAYASH